MEVFYVFTEQYHKWNQNKFQQRFGTLNHVFPMLDGFIPSIRNRNTIKLLKSIIPVHFYFSDEHIHNESLAIPLRINSAFKKTCHYFPIIFVIFFPMVEAFQKQSKIFHEISNNSITVMMAFFE